MAISRFDEGTLDGALLGYWNPAEQAPTLSGNDILTLPPVYPVSAPTLGVRADQEEPNTYDGTQFVGLAPAWQTYTGNAKSGLLADLGAEDDFVNGICIGALFEPLALDVTQVWSVHTDGFTAEKHRYRRQDSNHTAVWNGTPTDTGHLFELRPCATLINNYAAGGYQVSVRDTGKDVIYDNPAQKMVDVRYFTFGDSSDGAGYPLRGNIAIIVIYNRELTAQEEQDVQDLMWYWQENGTAPPVGPPTTVTFGPVATNDDPRVTSWQWQESPDGTAWQDVGTILTDTTGATTTSLVINSATAAMHNTRVRCRAISADEPTGVFSNSAVLTVT